MNTTSHSSDQRAFSSDQRMVLWVLWLTYGSFYFCRNNLSVALPGIQEELGYTKSQMGTVLMVLKLAYGAGQFINGQMAEHWQPRKLLALGLLASAALNVVFGWMTALYFLTFVWACNGYVQALGWPPTMRVAANWFPPLQRGRAIGIIGTGYQLCGALTFVVAGWAAERFGWRGALYVPAVLVSISAVHMLVFLKEKPAAEHALEDMEHATAMANRSLRENLVVTLTNPALWLVAVALCLLDACRYGFTDWGVTHLKEVQNASVGTAAFKYAVLPFGGIAGAYLSGWATDRFFKGRRAPVICILLFALGLLALAYDSVIHWGMLPSVAILFCIGFCIFGPQVLLVGTLPVDLARRGTAAAAVGFVNFMGYMGAAAGDKLTGRLAEDYGWPTAVRFWAACAFAGSLVIACLWKATARPHNT
ncbi:MFS transporter [Prosthecobacter sp.]|uniref:MFS transporter n=1 Tax=Prosthecobacter sp. TaxID=1965333 RepID=UPI002AB9A4F9|nr:MFS transporter [Prosthecobacter sp.]MDZ4405693.1 MFS transporter [Prosthecobacter sp.]